MTTDMVKTRKIGQSAAKLLNSFHQSMEKVQRLSGCGVEGLILPMIP